MKKDGEKDGIVFMGRPRTMISGTICEDPRTVDSVRIFEGGRRFRRTAESVRFLKVECRAPRTAESVRIFKGNAGIYEPPDRYDF